MGIVYKLTNSITGKSYIGYTTKTLEQRFEQHVFDALERKSNTYLHRSIRKHGEEAFTKEVIAESDDVEELKRLEIFYIKEFQTYGKGYNMTTGGDGVPGYEWTDEVRAVLSEKSKKQWESPEYKEFMREVARVSKKKHWSDPEYRKYISDAVKEQWQDPNVRSKMAKSISNAIKERWKDETYRNKLIKSFKETRKGSKHPNSGIDENKAREIINLLKEEPFLSHAKIAEKTGVSTYIVDTLCIGKNWSHVFYPGEPLPSEVRKQKQIERALEIGNMIMNSNMSYTQIAKKFKVSKSLVSHIALGIKYKELFPVTPIEVRNKNKV